MFATQNFVDCGFSHFCFFIFRDAVVIVLQYDYTPVLRDSIIKGLRKETIAKENCHFMPFCTAFPTPVVWSSFIPFQLPLHGLAGIPATDKVVIVVQSDIDSAKVVSSTIAPRMFEVESCICGFHVYEAEWTRRIEEILDCARETGNREDTFTLIAVKKQGNDWSCATDNGVTPLLLAADGTTFNGSMKIPCLALCFMCSTVQIHRLEVYFLYSKLRSTAINTISTSPQWQFCGQMSFPKQSTIAIL